MQFPNTAITPDDRGRMVHCYWCWFGYSVYHVLRISMYLLVLSR